MSEAIEGEHTGEPARTTVIDTELAQVVELARGGDALAFRDLFQQYNSQICTYLARLVSNDEAGRDLAQETFLRAWKSLPEIRSDAHFKAWLFRIATNIAMSHLRHTRLVRWLPWQEEEHAVPHINLSIAGPEEHAGEAECVQYALAQLAPQCRTCLLLQLVAGFSQREIAESLGIREKSVSAYVSRGREQFRRAYIGIVLHPPIIPTGRRARDVPDTKLPRRVVRLASIAAAVLVIGALLSGFLLLFNAHRTLVGGNAGAHTIFAASDESDGSVYALRPSDGALYWKYSIGQKLTGALVASDDTLYVGSYDRHVYALHKSDGSLLWTSATNPGDATAPTFADNTAVYVSSTTTISALSITDGHLLWSRKTAQCSICVATFVAINGGTLYAYLDGLYALNASDGKVLWHHPELSFSSRSFAVIDGNVFVPDAHSGTIYELRASDGQRLKTFTFQQDEPLEMVAADGAMYVDSAGHDVYAIRASDAARLWHKHFDDLRLGLSGPGDGAIYFAQNIATAGSPQTSASDLYALNTSDGAQRWAWQPSQFIGVSPVTVFDSFVYFFAGNNLYALNSSTGKQLWQVSESARLNNLLIG